MMNWAVAVTTSPREDCTLLKCVDSIRTCGWEPIVFAEPDSTPTDAFTIHNPKRLGAWHNWLSSVRYCLENTNAEAIMTVQDDAFFHPQSKVFSEKILWPDNNTGLVSLYTAKHYSVDSEERLLPRGFKQLAAVELWGACCLIFPRKPLEKLLKTNTVKNWLGVYAIKNPQLKEYYQSNPHLIVNVDIAIGRAIRFLRKTMWFVDPSPVTHIAKHSTLGHGSNKDYRNCIRPADHSISLFEQVPRPFYCDLSWQDQEQN